MNRYWPVVALLFCIPSQVLGQVSETTVTQLEQAVTDLHGKNDADAVIKLGEMRLTERLSTVRLQNLLTRLPGQKSRDVLAGLADMSTFLLPPPSEVPSTAPPDEATQHSIMGKVVDYVARTNHKLPNFFATRKIIRYEDWPKDLVYKGSIAGRYIPPQVVGRIESTVTYRNGEEVASSTTNKFRKQITTESGLYSWGLFGPVLATVLMDASRGSSAWSHWELDGAWRLAVFRYSIPADKSNYRVKFCCYPSGSILVPIDRDSAYHGEISVDPETGIIVRLTLIADLDKGDLATMLMEASAGAPLSRADMMVEYGQVEIGAKNYICPIRSVAISVARVPLMHQTPKSSAGQRGFPVKTAPPAQSISPSRKDPVLELGPARTYINEMSFTDYHVFRSESRIILDGMQ